jgi:hypothetical protein
MQSRLQGCGTVMIRIGLVIAIRFPDLHGPHSSFQLYEIPLDQSLFHLQRLQAFPQVLQHLVTRKYMSKIAVSRGLIEPRTLRVPEAMHTCHRPRFCYRHSRLRGGQEFASSLEDIETSSASPLTEESLRQPCMLLLEQMTDTREKRASDGRTG